jgi:hypothetical protein
LLIWYQERFLLDFVHSMCTACATVAQFKGDLNMKTRQWIGQNALRAGLLGMLLAASGSAMAASYNIILKDSGTALTCAPGAFLFDKSTVSSYPTTSPTTSPSVTLNGSAATPCFGVNQNLTLSTGTVNVTVANVTLNGQDQGPNVVSISGSLSSGGNGANDYTINFANDKSFTVTQNIDQNPVVGSGTYHIYNINSVPEPESLALALLGLGALALTRLRARRRG